MSTLFENIFSKIKYPNHNTISNEFTDAKCKINSICDDLFSLTNESYFFFKQRLKLKKKLGQPISISEIPSIYSNKMNFNNTIFKESLDKSNNIYKKSRNKVCFLNSNKKNQSILPNIKNVTTNSVSSNLSNPIKFAYRYSLNDLNSDDKFVKNLIKVQQELYPLTTNYITMPRMKQISEGSGNLHLNNLNKSQKQNREIKNLINKPPLYNYKTTISNKKELKQNEKIKDNFTCNLKLTKDISSVKYKNVANSMTKNILNSFKVKRDLNIFRFKKHLRDIPEEIVKSANFLK